MLRSEPTLAISTSDEPGAAKNGVISRGSERIRVIEPGTVSLKDLAKDLWRSRELVYFLIWRDIKVRYKQTALGVFWAILQPVISMVVMTFVFGRLGGIAKLTGRTPYPVFVYSGLLPWTFFASALTSSGTSVVANAALITKIRFPRIALPITAIAGEAVDFLLSFVVLLGLMFWYHIPLTAGILMTPFLLLGVAAIGLGIGSVFASLNVKYRDIRFVLPFITQIWMYLTPVIYPATLIPAKYRWVMWLNPLNGWIGGFRSAFLGFPVPWRALEVSALVSVVALLLGVYYFRLTEREFAEVI